MARQTPLSMEFSRQESWSALPFPTLGDLPDPGIDPPSLASAALAGRFFTAVNINIMDPVNGSMDRDLSSLIVLNPLTFNGAWSSVVMIKKIHIGTLDEMHIILKTLTLKLITQL